MLEKLLEATSDFTKLVRPSARASRSIVRLRVTLHDDRLKRSSGFIAFNLRLRSIGVYEAHLARIKSGDADPNLCQLCCAGVLGSKHPKYQHVPELVRKAAAATEISDDDVIKRNECGEGDVEVAPDGERKRLKPEP